MSTFFPASTQIVPVHQAQVAAFVACALTAMLAAAGAASVSATPTHAPSDPLSYWTDVTLPAGRDAEAYERELRRLLPGFVRRVTHHNQRTLWTDGVAVVDVVTLRFPRRLLGGVPSFEQFRRVRRLRAEV